LGIPLTEYSSEQINSVHSLKVEIQQADQEVAIAMLALAVSVVTAIGNRSPQNSLNASLKNVRMPPASWHPSKSEQAGVK